VSLTHDQRRTLGMMRALQGGVCRPDSVARSEADLEALEREGCVKRIPTPTSRSSS
jgi:hypothetical protein